MQIFKPIKNITQQFLHLVMPPTCISCRDIVEIQGQLCGGCWGQVQFIGKHKCHCCGVPFAFDMGDKAFCNHCSAEKPLFKKVRAVCKYTSIGKRLAANLKFHDRTHLAKSMAQMMFNAGGEVLKTADIIAPIPLHRRRKFFRKYNQSALLAEALTKHATKAEYMPNLLKRVRATTPQTRLNYKERKENVFAAFELLKNTQIEGKTILLIDDVMTTGATMNACAKALREGGAKQVNGLVFARVSVD